MQKFNRWLAKRRLINRYEYLTQVNIILEQYITHRILSGGNPEQISKARNELIEKQNEVKETQKLLSFLKQLK